MQAVKLFYAPLVEVLVSPTMACITASGAFSFFLARGGFHV